MNKQKIKKVIVKFGNPDFVYFSLEWKLGIINKEKTKLTKVIKKKIDIWKKITFTNGFYKNFV